MPQSVCHEPESRLSSCASGCVMSFPWDHLTARRAVTNVEVACRNWCTTRDIDDLSVFGHHFNQFASV
jgi:hypothetical protein